MIPGLDLSPTAEKEVWSAFETWSAEFKQRLREGGVDALVLRYEALVRALESPNASMGIYEYTNELSSRMALQRLLSLIPPPDRARLALRVAALDRRLQALAPDRTEFLLKDSARTRYPREVFWWYYGRPGGVRS